MIVKYHNKISRCYKIIQVLWSPKEYLIHSGFMGGRWRGESGKRKASRALYLHYEIPGQAHAAS